MAVCFPIRCSIAFSIHLTDSWDSSSSTHLVRIAQLLYAAEFIMQGITNTHILVIKHPLPPLFQAPKWVG
jgi:hypothetical protein